MRHEYVLLNKAKKASKRILFWDLGNGVEHAKRLALDGHEVLYYTSFLDPDPHFKKYAPGLGYTELKKVKKFDKYIDDVDYIFFMDIGKGDQCDWLRSKGYKVYGAGKGERLETDRAWSKKIQKQVGLAVQPYTVVNGIDNLLEHIKKNPKKYVKLNIFRGDQESFFASDEEEAKTILNPFRSKIGPFEDSFKFIVEDPIKYEVETGWDLFFNGKEFLKPYLWGYCQERFYIGKYADKLPAVLEDVRVRITPVLQMLNYRGNISMEVLVEKSGKGYVTDWTPRIPLPLSFCWTKSIRNYADVLMGCANGDDVRIQPNGKYIGYVEMRSQKLSENWLKVTFPRKYNDNVKLWTPAKYEGDYYALPNKWNNIGSIAADSSKIDDLFEKLIEIGDEVNAYGNDIGEASDSIEKIKGAVNRGKKVGLDF